MKGLGALGQVAMREISERARSKAYLLTTALTILIVLGLIVLPQLFGGDTEESTVGSVGEGNDAIISTLREHATPTAEFKLGNIPSAKIYELDQHSLPAVLP